MAQQVESYRVAALSTGHITREDAECLINAASGSDRIFERAGGFIIKLYRDHPEYNYEFHEYGISEYLKGIIRWALDEDYSMIEFDTDIEPVDLFPYFEDSWF